METFLKFIVRKDFNYIYYKGQTCMRNAHVILMAATADG